MNIRNSILCLLSAALIPLASGAQGPSTRPGDVSRERGDRPRDGREGRMGGGMGGGMGMGGQMRHGQDDAREAAPEEISRAIDFLKENFPNRHALFESIPPRFPRVRDGLTGRIVRQFRRLSEMKLQHPEMYESVMTEQKLLDDAVGLLQESRDSKEGAEAKLKAKIDELVETQLRERKLRIERLEQVLAEQKAQLSRDMDRKTELAEQRRDQLERDIKLPGDRDDERPEKPAVDEARPKS